jgi:TonB-linked SusC/RagA family outer membrane protein
MYTMMKMRLPFFSSNYCIYYILIFLMAMLFGGNSNSIAFAESFVSQNDQGEYKTLTGKVTDSGGIFLPGVNIVVKGTGIGTSTDGEGFFSLKIPDGKEFVLLFSFIGMEQKEITVASGEVTVNVILQESENKLDEVVAIGYQNVQRRKVTAAMTTIKAEEIENVPYSSIDQVLSGKVAGLTSISTSGEPGANTIVNIRGSNSVSLGGVSYPLYVIDGMIYDVNDMPSAYGNNPLAAINPNDIESVDVLKDASAAAIYGSRAANGVILIKTKRGKISEKPEIRLNVYTGIGSKPTLRDIITGAAERKLKLDLLYSNLGSLNKNDISMFLTDSLNAAFNNNTDWQDIFVQNSSLYNVDASISGSFGENNRYRVSMGYYDEEGVLIGYGLKRFSPKVYLSLQPKKRINFTVDFSPSFISIKHGYGNSSTYPFSTWSFPSSFWGLTNDQIATYRGQVGNMDEDKITTLISNAKLNISLTENLLFTSSFSNTYRNNRRDYLYSNLINEYSDEDIAKNWDYETTVWETENYLSYSKNLSNHSFSVIAGQQASRQNNKSTYAYGEGALANTIYDLSPGTGMYVTTYAERKGRLGIFGRINYDYKGKYLFSSSYRRDASSRYNKSKRWADFYSMSAGWIISDERFFNPLKNVINNMKFRASYGVTGNDPASYYAQYNLYTANSTYYGSSFGKDNSATASSYNGTTAVSQNYSSYAADKNVTWERYPQLNVGIDFGLFKNRIDIQADWYVRDSENIYYSDLTAPVTSGYSYYSGNVISLRNTGFEFTVNTINLGHKSKFKWNSTLTLGINENYVTKLPNGGKDLTVGSPWLQYTLTVGKPLFTYRVWETDGIYSNDEDVPTDPLTGDKMTYFGSTIKAGDPKYVDQNGDYNINYNDYVYKGDPNAEITGGFTNTFSYKNWSLSVLCNFVLGREIWNGYTSDLFNGSKTYTAWGSYGAIALADEFNYYTGDGDTDADYGDVISSSGVDRFHIANSKFIEDGSFFRVKNIMLGYRVPEKFGKKLKIRDLRLYGMIDNVLLITDSTLPDPEAVGPNGHSTGNNYPLAMKFTFGLTASF